jgi:arylsulfatase A-like enzyme
MLLGAMVSSMDKAMANITQALKATKQWNNTLIVWVSDNGGPTGVGQVGAKANSCSANNYPLRGGKGSAFQVLLLIGCAINKTVPNLDQVLLIGCN